MTPRPRASLLRDRHRDDSSRVGMVELFFDLVFVFAVTQLSHHLLEHLDWLGAVRTLLLFLAVWWLWMFTTWTTNWLDPERIPVRLMLLAMMLGGVLLAASLPQAMAGRGLVFGAVFAAMQVGRTLFMTLAFKRHGRPHQTRNFIRILLWLMVSAVPWIAGGLADPGTRILWWSVAVAIEYLGPLAYFRVPGMGASSTADWDVDGHHMAERCALFVIIALGESLLITGATFAGMAWQADTVAALLAAFGCAVAMWWIYFDTGAERASEVIAQSSDSGRIARNAYTYLHIPIIAGIIVTAVSDELVLAHPQHASDATLVAILGGPALYLLGNAGFKWVTNERKWPPFSHLAGLLLLGALAIPASAHMFETWLLSTLTTGTLVVVATWESIALRRPPRQQVARAG